LYGRYTNVEYPREWVTEYRFADLGDSRCHGGSAIDLSAADPLWAEPLPVVDDNLHRPVAVPGTRCAWQSLSQTQAVQLACAAAISAENDPGGFAYVLAGHGSPVHDM